MKKDSNKEMDIKREKEMKTVRIMIIKYCKGHKHLDPPCINCSELIQYAENKIENCPFIAIKTYCSNCEVHCYSPEMRTRIKEVMRYSGPRMLFSHPIMVIDHLYQGLKYKMKYSKGTVGK